MKINTIGHRKPKISIIIHIKSRVGTNLDLPFLLEIHSPACHIYNKIDIHNTYNLTENQSSPGNARNKTSVNCIVIKTTRFLTSQYGTSYKVQGREAVAFKTSLTFMSFLEGAYGVVELCR